MFFKKKSVRLSGLALVAVLAMNLFGNISGVPGGARAQDTQSFTDVPMTHWAYESIQRAADNGWVQGVGDGRFDPSGTVSSAQFVVMLTRAFYQDSVDAIKESGIGKNLWWYANCMAGYANGVILGTKLGDSHEADFRWDEDILNAPISRYDMAQMMLNIMSDNDFKVSEAEKRAAQAKIGDWAEIPTEYRDAVSSVYALSIIQGRSDGTFGGQYNMSRAEAAVVLVRLSDATGKGSPVDPEPTPDVTPEPTPEPTEKPDVTEPPVTTEPVLANGEPVTEDNVLAIIEELRDKYPDGSTYDPDTRYPWKGYPYNGLQCGKLAFMLSDEIFGSLPARSHQDFDNIKVGDLIEDDSPHWRMVITAPDGDGYFYTVDGGASGVIRWDILGTNTRMDNGNSYTFHVWTRYPQ